MASKHSFQESTTEAERAVLGGLLRFPESADHVASRLSRTHFADAALGDCVGLLCDIHAARQIDISDTQAVISVLRSAGMIDRIGGTSTIVDVFRDAPLFPSNVPHFVNEVIRFSRLRRLATVAQDTLAQVEQPGADPDRIAELASVASDGAKMSEAADLSDMLLSLAIDMDRQLSDPDHTTFIRTGIEELDAITGGMANGELIVVGARTSVGKTALGVQIALDAAKRGNKTLLLSLEMQEIQLAQRIVAMELTGLSLLDMRTGAFGSGDADQVRKLASQMQNVPFAVQPAFRSSMARIRSYARSHKATKGLSLLVVDYLQLINGDRKMSRFDRISDTSNDLKNLALELNVPVIALAQLNREGKDEPTIEHLKGSGDIEQDADMIWLLHRADASTTKLIVGKNRQGPKDTINLRFDGESCRFSEQGVESHPNYRSEFSEWKQDWVNEFKVKG